MSVIDPGSSPSEVPFDAELDPLGEAGTESIDEPPPLRVRARAVGESERFLSLDVVRGIAVFGILLVNIGDFSLVPGARYDPSISGGDGPWNRAVWLGIYGLADTKFIAIFTMLFGAGIALANQRRKLKRERRALAYYRRMFFLLMLGLAHGFLIWDGDILYYYAFWGLLFYFVPRIPSPITITVACILLVLNSVRTGAWMIGIRPRYTWFHLNLFQGTWADQFAWRMENFWYATLQVPWWYGLHVGGFLLLGIVLLKNGFLCGERSNARYLGLALVLIPSGVALVGFGTQLDSRFESFFHAQFFILGSMFLTFGYIAGGIMLSKVGANWLPVRALAAVGRMALTNYLSHSVICSVIFYGWGFGFYEKLDRIEIFGIIVAICVFQLIVSLLWLRVFRFGPVEWLWRMVTYLRWQRMRQRPDVERLLTI